MRTRLTTYTNDITEDEVAWLQKLEIGTHWSDEYHVGHPDIDAQHKHIFTLLTMFQEAAQGPGSDIDVMFEHIARFLSWHFATEEAVMEARKYPLIAEHKEEHRKCVATVDEFRAQIGAGGPLDTPAIVRFLLAWLDDHLLKSDRKLMLYLRSSD